MNILNNTDNALLNFSRNQQDEATSVSRLSSGLRIQSAADDPSGNSISQTLQSKVNGLQQSVQNVQTANNVMNTADGALETVTEILQRVRSLVVEARSDINSLGQLQSIQTEINQLLLEVNRIGENTNFNGMSLFNGQFDAGVPNPVPYGAQAVQNFILAPGGYEGTNSVVNADGLGNPGPLITLQGPGVSGAGNFTPALMIFQVIGYSANAVDPDSGINVGPGVLVQFTAYSQDPTLGAAPVFQDTSAVAVNSGPVTAQYSTPLFNQTGSSSASELLTFTLSNLTAADVGATVAFITTNGTPTKPSGQALEVNDGGQEGSTVAISIPTLNTQALNIQDISVLPTGVVDIMNNQIGASSSNSIQAADAEIRTDAALDQVNSIRAQMGAQMVSLQEDANNDGTAIVNYTASVSSIRDLDIGATVSVFTKQQILTQVGTSVISQNEVSALALTRILVSALGG